MGVVAGHQYLFKDRADRDHETIDRLAVTGRVLYLMRAGFLLSAAAAPGEEAKADGAEARQSDQRGSVPNLGWAGLVQAETSFTNRGHDGRPFI
ncbi:MAG: hypothetical protein B7Z73_03110 [Planctomycetia bacterium 21-64-5]|nr:MAG: hypothetical protein B7Z73_03110 [Planctomycetia bacterium 21-64-5]